MSNEVKAPTAAQQPRHARVIVNGESDRAAYYQDEPDRVTFHSSRGEADAVEARAQLTARTIEACRRYGHAKIANAAYRALEGRTSLLEPVGLQDLVGKLDSLNMVAAFANRLTLEERSGRS